MLLIGTMLVSSPNPQLWKSPLQELGLSAWHPRIFGMILIISQRMKVRTEGQGFSPLSLTSRTHD